MSDQDQAAPAPKRRNAGQFQPGQSGNRAGRPRRADSAEVTAPAGRPAVADLAARARPTAQRRDGWINDASGHGTTRDRRLLTRYGLDIVTDIEALQLWRSEFLAAAIIEDGPKEAFRRPWGLKIDDKKTAEAIVAQAQDLQATQKVVLAAQYENAYGGAAIFPVLSGALDELSQPLEERAIASVDALHVFEPQELTPAAYYADIRSPKFLQPSVWRLQPLSSGRGGFVGSTLIHESRLVMFPGVRVSKQTQPGQREGWGDSALCRPRSIIADFGLAWGSAAILLQNHGKETYELEGFAEMMAESDGLAEFDNHIAAMQLAWSVLRMNVVDGKSRISRSTGTLAGVSEVLNEFKVLMAAAARRPVSVLMGQSQSGLRSGDDDTRAWYATVERDRADRWHSPLERIVQLLLLATAGPTSGREPDAWSVEYPALWSPSEKEVAETRKTDADRAKTLIEVGVTSADDVAESFYKGDTYSGDIVIDWARREKQAAIDAEAAEELGEEDLDALDADGGTDVPDDEELDALELEDEEDLDFDDDVDLEDEDREDALDDWARFDDGPAPGGAAGRAGGKGYNPYRSKNGKFAPGPRAQRAAGPGRGGGGKASATAFKSARHERRIAAAKRLEAKHRTASLKVRDQMAALRAKAKGGSPAQKARIKEQFDRLKTKRDGLRAKAAEAKAQRVQAGKDMRSARAEHAAKRRAGRGAAKDQAAGSKRKPDKEGQQRPLKSAAESKGALSDREFDSMVADASKVLSTGDMAIVRDYTQPGMFGVTNSRLREHESVNAQRAAYFASRGKAFTPSELDASTKTAVDGLDGALAKTSAPRDMEVYRGLREGGLTDQITALKPGQSFTDAGYGSTSQSQDVGQQYTGASGVLLKVNVRKGQSVLAVPNSEFSKERELLLPRNTKYTVIKSEIDADGRRVVEVSVGDDRRVDFDPGQKRDRTGRWSVHGRAAREASLEREAHRWQNRNATDEEVVAAGERAAATAHESHAAEQRAIERGDVAKLKDDDFQKLVEADEKGRDELEHVDRDLDKHYRDALDEVGHLDDFRVGHDDDGDNPFDVGVNHDEVSDHFQRTKDALSQATDKQEEPHGHEPKESRLKDLPDRPSDDDVNELTKPDRDDFDDDEDGDAEYQAAESEYSAKVKQHEDAKAVYESALAEKRKKFEEQAHRAQDALERLRDAQVEHLERLKTADKELAKAKRKAERELEQQDPDDDLVNHDKFDEHVNQDTGEIDDPVVAKQYDEAQRAAQSMHSSRQSDIDNGDFVNFEDPISALKEAVGETSDAIKELSKITGRKLTKRVKS